MTRENGSIRLPLRTDQFYTAVQRNYYKMIPNIIIEISKKKFARTT
jgi:hypothetical protein